VSSYAHPDVLVDTQWVAEHLNDPKVRIAEVGTSTTAYDSGHIPGAVCWDVYRDILQPNHVIVDKPTFETLLSQSGIANDMTIILYSSYAGTMAFWALRLYGHENMRLMNGGRKKWIDEGRPLTTEAPAFASATYVAKTPDWSIHAPREFVQESIGKANRVIIDVRNSKEYAGEMFWPNKPPIEGERAGHIPGAIHVPYELTLNDDGTFKSIEELQALFGSKGITADKEAITYCTVGARSCHTWFVLTYLLGYPHAQEYQESWYQWGRLPDTPVEK